MAESRTPATAAQLFQRLWDELVLLLGTTATATVVRRGLKRAAPRLPVLAELRIERDGLDYGYAVPASWRDPDHPAALAAVQRLYVEELDPLLRELTGSVVRRRLARIPGLAVPVAEPEEEPR